MDPDTALKQILATCAEIDKSEDDAERSLLAEELACLILGLDAWILARGSLPAVWRMQVEAEAKRNPCNLCGEDLNHPSAKIPARMPHRC